MSTRLLHLHIRWLNLWRRDRIGENTCETLVGETLLKNHAIYSLWVTDPASPSSSGPPTPSHSTTHIPLSASFSSATPGTHAAPSLSLSPPAPAASSNLSSQPPAPVTPHLPTPSQPTSHAAPFPSVSSSGTVQPVAPSIPASALPGARLSGRLVGVVSLTDILNLHARASGLNPADPDESRRRRRSSSSSVSVRRSSEMGREMFSRGGV